MAIVGWRPALAKQMAGVANTEIERFPISATKAPGIPDFGHVCFALPCDSLIPTPRQQEIILMLASYLPSR